MQATQQDEGGSSRDLGAHLERGVVALALWFVLASFLGSLAAFVGAWQPLVAASILALTGALAWRVSAAVPDPARRDRSAVPVLVLVLAVLAITVWSGLTHSEQLLPRRDSASYLQAAIQVADTGSRPVAVNPETIGGPAALELPGVTLASPAFYEIGPPDAPQVQPQFMPAAALTYSIPWWLGGAGATLWAPAVAGGLALLAIGLLVRRTIGSWWAAPAVLLIGACFPWLHTSRSTYSEPLAGLTLGAGFLLLTLVMDRSERPGGPAEPSSETPSPETNSGAVRAAALLAGVLIGGTSIVRIDALRETMLLLPVAALLLARGRTWARPLLVGAGMSTLVGFLVAGAMSWRYLGEIAGSLVPLVALVLLMSLLCAVALRRSRAGWSLPARWSALLPRALAGLVVLVGIGLAMRPLVMTARQDPRDPGAVYVARMQAEQGLTVDGGRTYAEHSVQWLSWWVGPVALVMALLVLAALAHRLGTAWRDGGRLPAWGAALVVTTGSTLLTLWRPGITPDHPWADRRLLIALPLAIVLAVAAAAWAHRALARRSGEGERAAPFAPLALLAGAGLLAVTAVPTLAATAPHASERIELGQHAAVEEVCAALEPQDVVLTVDDWAGNQWPQVVRGMCGRPALSVTPALRGDPEALAATAGELADLVAERGGRVLLLASHDREALEALEATDVRLVLDRTVEEDMRILEERPDGTTPLRMQLWSGRVGS